MGKRKRLTILAINRKFNQESEFIGSVKQVLGKHNGLNVILLFPESVLGGRPIERNAGRALARKVHSLAKSHGNAHVAYSTIERTVRKRKKSESVTIYTSGYFVKPKKGKSKSGYYAHHKLATYDGGKFLTKGDRDIITKNASPRSFSERVSRIFKKVQRSKSFPSVKIGGKTIQHRICADMHNFHGQDFHPAKSSNKENDVILVSADGLPPEDGKYIQSQLAEKGVVVIADPIYGLSLVKKNGRHVKIKDRKYRKLGGDVVIKKI